MVDLSKEEKEGIEELLETLKDADSGVAAQHEEVVRPTDTPEPDNRDDSAASPGGNEAPSRSDSEERNPDITPERGAVREILRLQNERLGVLSGKVDALTRMVELILTTMLGRKR